METKQYRGKLLLVTARELVASHGIFFAASLLMDFGIPLEAALRALCFKPIVIQPTDPTLNLGQVALEKAAASPLD